MKTSLRALYVAVIQAVRFAVFVWRVSKTSKYDVRVDVRIGAQRSEGDYMQRITVNLSDELHEKLRRRAFENRTTMSAIIQSLLEQSDGTEQKQSKDETARKRKPQK
jgi:hypothetical protein